MVNRKAKFNYTILEEFRCGIVLLGSEVKSVKANEMSIDESYCLLINGELFIRGMYIKPYEKSRDALNPTRDRKLLLRKKELNKIESQMSDKGLTIVPLVVTDKGLIKVIVGIGRGKKNYDKRQSLKAKDAEREISRLK
jgi:SsrA-binding protein